MPDCPVQLPWVRHGPEHTVLRLSGCQVLIGLLLQRSEQCRECCRLQLTLFEHQSPSGPAAYCPQHTIVIHCSQHTAASTGCSTLSHTYTGRTTHGCIRWLELTRNPDPNGWSSPGTAREPLWPERIFESSFNRRELQSELSCVVALQHPSIRVAPPQRCSAAPQHRSWPLDCSSVSVSYIYKDVIAMRTPLH